MSEFQNRILIDPSGTDVGKVTDVISDPRDLQPRYLVVRMGRLGGEHLIPLEAVVERDGQLCAAVDKDQVKAAPRIHDHTSLASTERDALYRHYGLAS